MAKTLAIYAAIQNTLAEAGILISEENAKALRIEHKVTHENVSEFCASYVATHKNSDVVKGDIVIRGINCRIWLNKKSLSGIIKLSDDSEKKLLSFEWGKNRYGKWFENPKVCQGDTQLRYFGKPVYDQVLKEWTILMDESNRRNYEIITAVKDAIIKLYRESKAA